MEGNHLLLAEDHALGVREQSINIVAVWAFDVHEERVWGLNLPLKLMHALLRGRVRVK